MFQDYFLGYSWIYKHSMLIICSIWGTVLGLIVCRMTAIHSEYSEALKLYFCYHKNKFHMKVKENDVTETKVLLTP